MRQKQFVVKFMGTVIAVFVLLLFPFDTLAAPVFAAQTGGDAPIAFIVAIGVLGLFEILRYRQAIKFQGKHKWQDQLGFHTKKKEE